MKKNILITGATGLIGSQLVKRLQKRGHQVSILSRNPAKVTNAKAYRWNVENQEIDKSCLSGIDTIVHLAGANIGAERWTEQRKQEIINSRVLSIGLLYKAVKETKTSIDTIISPSGVDYYGNRGDETLTEESGNGTGFMAECCRKWENAVDEGHEFGSRIVKLRLGVLLARQGGALAQMEKPVRCFVGAPLGRGSQWMSWIHFDDLLNIFDNAVEDDRYKGVYNVCSPFPVTNGEFTKKLAKALHRPIWPIKVPEVVLGAILGEMSSMVLTSNKASPSKIVKQGYDFRYPDLDHALAEIYK